jgi:hypothetical protein
VGDVAENKSTHLARLERSGLGFEIQLTILTAPFEVFAKTIRSPLRLIGVSGRLQLSQKRRDETIG